MPALQICDQRPTQNNSKINLKHRWEHTGQYKKNKLYVMHFHTNLSELSWFEMTKKELLRG